jgi:Icc protein
LLRVLHLTDPHLFAAKDGSLRGTVTFASLASVLDHYRSGDWQADVAVVTGDLIQDDSAEAYQHFRQLLGELGIPVYCVPGNHDIRDLMRDALSEAPFVYCGNQQFGDWLLVGMDSCVDGQAGGAIAAAEFDRVDDEIAASDASHVMLHLHHPPVAMGSRWLDTVGMDNGAEALRRFTACHTVHVQSVYPWQRRVCNRR